jgi:hypothetical protein
MYIVVHKGSACSDLLKHTYIYIFKLFFKIYFCEYVIVGSIVDINFGIWQALETCVVSCMEQ